MFSWMWLSTSSSECFSYIFGVKSMEYKLCFWSTLIGCFKCSFKSNDIDLESLFLIPQAHHLGLRNIAEEWVDSRWRMGKKSCKM